MKKESIREAEVPEQYDVPTEKLENWIQQKSSATSEDKVRATKYYLDKTLIGEIETARESRKQQQSDSPQALRRETGLRLSVPKPSRALA
jgi:hypothetical protein